MSRPYLLLLLTTLFWGGNAVAGKAAVGNIDPYVLILRALDRWPCCCLCRSPSARFAATGRWCAPAGGCILFYGAVGYAGFNVLIYVAAYFTSGINNAIDQVPINIFVMLINFALFRTRVRALQLVGVAITIVGVALTATHGDLGASSRSTSISATCSSSSPASPTPSIRQPALAAADLVAELPVRSASSARCSPRSPSSSASAAACRIWSQPCRRSRRSAG